MPEGDTIHRAARTMQRALAGETITAFRSRLPHLDLTGARVDSVQARGKNLLVRLEDGRTLHTHMQMTGSWHLYRAGEKWQKPRRQAVLIMETEPWIAVGFNIPRVELLQRERDSPALRKLGPDLLDDEATLESMLPRLRAVDSLPLGVAVMRQSTLAGIGNVYKSETCFIRRLDPFALVSRYDDEVLLGLLAEARRLLRKNLRGAHRITTRSGNVPLWVYGRAGDPCLVCETSIAMRRQGDMGRSTYFCPECQQTG